MYTRTVLSTGSITVRSPAMEWMLLKVLMRIIRPKTSELQFQKSESRCRELINEDDYELSKCNKPNREKAVFCKWCGTNVVTKATEPLRELVGMETVKNQLQDLVNTCESLALRAQRSGISIRLGMDMIITGNTGTGKTKLAEVLQNYCIPVVLSRSLP